MRPWIKRSLIGVFGASILIGGLSACGHYRHGGAWQMSEADSAKMREHMLERVGKELALDDAQKQRLVVLADKLKEQRAALVGNTTAPRAEFQALVAGPKFERDPVFPDRANISFAQVLSPEHIILRVWERGAGATRACGSAACAALVAAARKGLTGRKAVVTLPGGDLIIEWRESDGHVLMTGPTELEHEGTFSPALFTEVA